MKATQTKHGCSSFQKATPNIAGLVDTNDYVQTQTPVQNPAPEQNPASENRPGKRGKTRLADIWAMTGEYKIQLPLNDEGQPIGDDGILFIRWLGSFCENGLLCPLSPARWPSVPQKFKNDCWTEIEQRYIIDPTIIKPANQKGWAMSQLGELRRNRRTKLKKDYKKPGLSREEVLASEPPGVIAAHWKEMVDYWFNEKTETLSLKNKASRDKQKDIARCGAKSLAQISAQMAKDKGAAVERADVFQKVYRTKDGVAVSDHVQDQMDRMAALLNEQDIRLHGEIGNGILWSNDDAYARVIGRPERAGRVRGVGFGITPSGRNARNASQFTSTSTPSSSRTHERMLELETSHEELREALAKSREELAICREEVAQSEARHREELAQSEVRHQARMVEMMASMKTMFAALSQEVHKLGHDSDQGGSA
ncbi:uncharacterized protein LOC115970486 [Quercus lobata]|uniref:uncharacterized protein LOC115970486 n=1 Tax=Quercus lobata TaxID=97700 RepID=UPI001247E105|nr:uncharacterized protein LOC115970486 [Quercus lobata]